MGNEVLVSAEGLARSHGVRTLFEGVSFGVFAGDRVGLIGPNGSGKSTLLRILAGLEDTDGGQVSRRKFLRVAFVPQAPELPVGQAVGDVVAAALAKLDLPEHEVAARVATSLSKAGLADPAQLVGSLSGGWKKRLAIACALAGEPDVLLLDEPTNHLDVEGILALEELLVAERRTCVVVSHDRWFLENVATRVMELSSAWQSGLFASDGDYASFLEKREAAAQGQLAAQASLANVVRREIEWLRRGPKARTTKSQARIDSAMRLQDELKASTARTTVATARIDFTDSERKSKRLLTAQGVGKSLGGHRILADVDLTLLNGRRVGVIGVNGSGKTTLLRLLDGSLLPDEGSITRAPTLKVVRFEQDRESLDPAVSLQRALAPAGDAVTFRGEQVHVSSWARRFLFRPDQLQVPVGRLSGGEQARILVAQLMLRPADLLLLDEPTNDLDIPTLEVLEESLADFPGALVLVTHDRYMLDRVATSLVSIERDGRLVEYADLAQWQAARRDVADEPRSRGTAHEPRRASGSRGMRRLTHAEKKDWTGMEQRILAAEKHATRCQEAADDPAVATDAAALHERHEALDAARREVERLYARWTELEAKQEPSS